jgi:predicted DNA-binding protein with PD1-like motif
LTCTVFFLILSPIKLFPVKHLKKSVFNHQIVRRGVAFIMKYTQAKQGRVFVIRLEDGDILHDVIEDFAQKHGIHAASLIALGCADEGSVLVVGPEEGRSSPVTPMTHILDNVHEVAGVGTIFPDDDGIPILHMHLACGRKADTKTGCVRRGVRVWHVMEIILYELLESTGVRVLEPATGFKLLKP